MEQIEAKPISWEAVKMLALAVGVREAARRMGLSEEQVKKRCTRERWLANPEARIAAQRGVALRSGTSAPIPLSPMSPAALFSAELAALGQKTRVSLARGVSKAAETVENLSGREIVDASTDVKNIAQTADLIHGWKDAAPQVKIRLDVLQASSTPQIQDVEAELIDSDSWDNEQDLDTY